MFVETRSHLLPSLVIINSSRHEYGEHGPHRFPLAIEVVRAYGLQPFLRSGVHKFLKQ